MALFDVDFKILVRILTPELLRKPKRLAWLNALVSPAAYLYNQFMTNRYNNLYILNHSSQVTYMQAALNDAFDSVLRRIKIVDGVYHDPMYIYLDAEVKPVYIYTDAEAQPQYLYTNKETTAGGYDFIVQVPSSISYDVVYMKALINRFRLASKNYYSIVNV